MRCLRTGREVTEEDGEVASSVGIDARGSLQLPVVHSGQRGEEIRPKLADEREVEGTDETC
jgi:hypothetical protein